ncbi:hypothetical protein NC653_027056 [Populus alba x Populus x berolinensis]|uniref:Uncharacterized protein n=1 Tax=Populus alba x Populus x berolinensis TaxID=444605 RepID=A0AAD6M582_9ROSI|nr:hypothetical protein NC653_027056 [Populus alba x Populus x berolinensis]
MQEEEGTLSQQQGPCLTSLPLASHSNEMFLPLCKSFLLLLILTERVSFPLVVRRKSLLAYICWHLLSSESSHFSWR